MLADFDEMYKYEVLFVHVQRFWRCKGDATYVLSLLLTMKQRPINELSTPKEDLEQYPVLF